MIAPPPVWCRFPLPCWGFFSIAPPTAGGCGKPVHQRFSALRPRGDRINFPLGGGKLRCQPLHLHLMLRSLPAHLVKLAPQHGGFLLRRFHLCLCRRDRLL